MFGNVCSYLALTINKLVNIKCGVRDLPNVQAPQRFSNTLAIIQCEQLSSYVSKAGENDLDDGEINFTSSACLDYRRVNLSSIE